MTFIETNDHVRLSYVDWGEGPPVVLVHAWALHSDMWNYQVPALVDAGLRVITYDRRGHGRSERPGRGYDYDTLADDLATVVERLDLREVSFVGHSLGCGEIVRYVTRHGVARVARAALLGPLMPFLIKTADNPDGMDPAGLAASAAALAADVPQWSADGAVAFFGSAKVSAGLQDWLLRQFNDTPLKVLLDTMQLFATDFRAELPGFDVPTLILHGDADTSAPLELTGRKAAAQIPGGRLVVYPGGGHGLFASEHGQVNSDLITFIRSRHPHSAGAP